MMMRTAIAILGALAATFALGGCDTLREIAGDAPKPDARVTSARLRSIDLQSATIDFDVEVRNPYDVDLPLVNVDYALASTGRQFVEGEADLSGVVPARDVRSVSLPATVRFSELLTTLRRVRPGQVVDYEAELGLSVNPPAVGSLRLPLRHQGRLPVPAAPAVAVTGVSFDELSLRTARATVRLELENTNQFAFALDRMAYALSIGGYDVAASSLASGAEFPPGERGVVEIPISFSPIGLGSAALSLFSGDGASYRVSGELDAETPFGAMTLPFEREGRTDFSR